MDTQIIDWNVQSTRVTSLCPKRANSKVTIQLSLVGTENAPSGLKGAYHHLHRAISHMSFQLCHCTSPATSRSWSCRQALNNLFSYHTVHCKVPHKGSWDYPSINRTSVVSPLPILDTLPTEGVTSFTGHWYIEDSMARVKKINKIMFTYACRN